MTIWQVFPLENLTLDACARKRKLCAITLVKCEETKRYTICQAGQKGAYRALALLLFILAPVQAPPLHPHDPTILDFWLDNWPGLW
jgi:hypothetical protein